MVLISKISASDLPDADEIEEVKPPPSEVKNEVVESPKKFIPPSTFYGVTKPRKIGPL